MKIVVTGASGMLGTDLVSRLSPSFEVVGVGLKQTQPLSIPYEEIDLSEQSSTDAFFDRHAPQVVFHTAAVTDVDGCEKEREKALAGNLNVTQNVADACQKKGAFLIFFSTDYVFDGTQEGDYLEADPPAPVNFYGETKYLAEKYIIDKIKAYWVIRISWLFGLYGKSFPRTILERAKSQPEFRVVNDQIGRPTYTKDLAEALTQALVNKNGDLSETQSQLFHMGNAGTTSWAEFAKQVLQSAGIEKQVVGVSTEEFPRPAKRPKRSVLSLERSTSMGLGLRPWKEATTDFVQEFMKKEVV